MPQMMPLQQQQQQEQQLSDCRHIGTSNHLLLEEEEEEEKEGEDEDDGPPPHPPPPVPLPTADVDTINRHDGSSSSSRSSSPHHVNGAIGINGDVHQSATTTTTTTSKSSTMTTSPLNKKQPLSALTSSASVSQDSLTTVTSSLKCCFQCGCTCGSGERSTSITAASANKDCSSSSSNSSPLLDNRQGGDGGGGDAVITLLRQELEASRIECKRLAQIRDDCEAEVRELTASLFQEAHVMVNAANVKAAASEKALKEARMQLEGLHAQVEALKTLVITSTPSRPNVHLHPQLQQSQPTTHASSSFSSSSLGIGGSYVNGGTQPLPMPTSSSSSAFFAGRFTSGGGGGGGANGSAAAANNKNRTHRRGASDFDLKYSAAATSSTPPYSSSSWSSANANESTSVTRIGSSNGLPPPAAATVMTVNGSGSRPISAPSSSSSSTSSCPLKEDCGQQQQQQHLTPHSSHSQATGGGFTEGQDDEKQEGHDGGSGQEGEADDQVDPVFFSELEAWRREPTLPTTTQLDDDAAASSSLALLRRLFAEDIRPCLDFGQGCSGGGCGDSQNGREQRAQLVASRVARAVQLNAIDIEDTNVCTHTRCALLNVPRPCRYRIKLGDDDKDKDKDKWYPISTLCRNRITAVCDTLTYLRYMQLGLVKSSSREIYWHLMDLRKQMTLARLGLSSSSSASSSFAFTSSDLSSS